MNILNLTTQEIEDEDEKQKQINLNEVLIINTISIEFNSKKKPLITNP